MKPHFVLSNQVKAELKKQFQAASNHFGKLVSNRVFGAEPEATGGFVSGLIDRLEGQIGNVAWTTKMKTLKAAEESQIGADIIFRIDVEDKKTNSQKSKTILIQSKWEEKILDYAKDTLEQIKDMNATQVDSCFATYSNAGVKIIECKHLKEKLDKKINAKRGIKITPPKSTHLSDYFVEEFLACHIGTRDLDMDKFLDKYTKKAKPQAKIVKPEEPEETEDDGFPRYIGYVPSPGPLGEIGVVSRPWEKEPEKIISIELRIFKNTTPDDQKLIRQIMDETRQWNQRQLTKIR